jgi:hypothetical protein
MSNSSIVVRTKYQLCNNLKTSVSKTISYIGDKKKADATNIDEYNILKDYMSMSDKESYLYEKSESFFWNASGNVDAKKDLKKIQSLLDRKGTLWSLVVSFPPDFAIDNGLVTKMDYHQLTNNFMPTFLTGMGLNINNVTWYCSLHRNTKNPHLHINFFEHTPTISNPKIPYSCIHKLKSDIANYIINNEEFYKLRDKEFQSIVGTISLNELNKVKNQKLFSESFRRCLNKMLVDYYSTLPKNIRLQYNAKAMIPYKKDLDAIINYILMHDSVKYNYANYLKLLTEHQKQLLQVYGDSKDNKNQNYYNNQLNKLYSKIGNEILQNFKIYNSIGIIEKETLFLKKHIIDLNFKSRDYAKDKSKENIAKNLYKICMLCDLNDYQINKVFSDWTRRSKYTNMDINSIIASVRTDDYDMTSTELYDTLKKLGYDYKKYKTIKDKNFYKELNYKKFINRAINHLMYEYEREQKEIEREMEYDLEGM